MKFSSVLEKEFVSRETKIEELFTRHIRHKKVRLDGYECSLNSSMKIIVEAIVFNDELHRVQMDFEGTISYTISVQAYTDDGMQFKASTAGLTEEQVDTIGYHNIEERLLSAWKSFS